MNEYRDAIFMNKHGGEFDEEYSRQLRTQLRLAQELAGLPMSGDGVREKYTELQSLIEECERKQKLLVRKARSQWRKEKLSIAWKYFSLLFILMVWLLIYLQTQGKL